MQSNFSKIELRKILQKRIKAVLDTDTELHYQTKYNLKVLHIIQNFIPYIQSNAILAYYPMAYEASCLSVLSDALDNKKTIFLPKLHNNKMHFLQCTTLDTKNDFFQNSYGIYEPSGNNFVNISDFVDKNDDSPLLIFIPALAYTLQGNRLGRGKAYYDTFLVELLELKKKRPVVFIGLCFSFQIIETIPTENHDISVDYILCEDGIINCKESYTLHT